MKKRIIWYVVLMLLMTAAIVLVVVPEVRNILRDTGLYIWAQENLYDVYHILRYGNGRFALVSIILLVFVVFVTFVVLNVKAVKASDIEPKTVVQKPTVIKQNGKATIIVVKESEGAR